MIEVVVRRIGNDAGGSEIVGISCKGHSHYGGGGDDIVCASVSTLMDALETGLRDANAHGWFRVARVSVVVDYECNGTSYTWSGGDKLWPLFETIALSLKRLAGEYPEDVSFAELRGE
ncbi:ribosomal-processing cysteine protease Prp [Cloacibacillus evryensis]|uniref:ribosomal-processing cysteine protease Prp n=1 Tax=Cloacibacillus evryensis TaxID=508460 RepID=UPI00241C9923|nr:ribosomal-processing cysteine protease Prp [Cloacibacillus evryensis]